MVQRMDWDPVKHRLARVELEVRVPEDFPERYRKALARSASLCAVKKTILDPPEFDVFTTVY